MSELLKQKTKKKIEATKRVSVATRVLTFIAVRK